MNTNILYAVDSVNLPSKDLSNLKTIFTYTKPVTYKELSQVLDSTVNDMFVLFSIIVELFQDYRHYEQIDKSTDSIAFDQLQVLSEWFFKDRPMKLNLLLKFLKKHVRFIKDIFFHIKFKQRGFTAYGEDYKKIFIKIELMYKKKEIMNSFTVMLKNKFKRDSLKTQFRYTNLNDITNFMPTVYIRWVCILFESFYAEARPRYTYLVVNPFSGIPFDLFSFVQVQNNKLVQVRTYEHLGHHLNLWLMDPKRKTN